MVKRSELENKIKEKILLIGDSATGKTYTVAKVAGYVAGNGKKVVLIDPEYGAERELELLPDDILENIELRVTPDWLKTKEALEKPDADCFLKMLDGLGDVFEQSMTYLNERFLGQGYYSAGDAEKEIKHKETFVFPWSAYPKVYDDVRKTVRMLCLKQAPHIICTMHSFGEAETRQRLTEDIYRKFDTTITLRREIVDYTDTVTREQTKKFEYQAILNKHRGKPITAFAMLKDHVGQLNKLFAKRMGMDYVEGSN